MLAVIFCLIARAAQAGDFPFGQVSLAELNMTVYEKDTTAVAVVLNEFGYAYFDSRDHTILMDYHVRIKILRQPGLDLANFSLPLYKYAHLSRLNTDVIRNVKASSFRTGPGGIVESKLVPKNVMTERNEHYDLKKFAIPNVVEGSVIEVSYQIETPYIFNFREWNFQREIPKVRSEYWASIPAYYRYNVSLVGFLQLSKNESDVIKNCFPSNIACSIQKFAMENIPAFVEEDFMTAKSNFISAIRFELKEIHHRTGSVDRITKEWKDVENELRQDSRFGGQLRRGENIMDKNLTASITAEADQMVRAKGVYDYIVRHYEWNGLNGKYCEQGIRKAFEAKSGNVGDINVSLIAALRYAGLEADPVILSTRSNGYVTELFPSLSDFNYVIARLVIDGKTYLLDATDPLMPFGMIPFHCLNGRGRVIGDRESSWLDIKAPALFRQTNFITLTFKEDGGLTGTIRNTYVGYDAVDRRRLIYSFDSRDAYKADVSRKMGSAVITAIDLQNLEDVSEPLVEVIDVELSGFNGTTARLLMNPFLFNKPLSNPFKSAERLYPVDFGANIDERITIVLEFPEEIDLVNIPEDVGLSLPNDGGLYMLRSQREAGKVSIVSWLNTKKPVYTHQEYFYLRELFSRIVQVQNTDLIFVKG